MRVTCSANWLSLLNASRRLELRTRSFLCLLTDLTLLRDRWTWTMSVRKGFIVVAITCLIVYIGIYKCLIKHSVLIKQFTYYTCLTTIRSTALALVFFNNFYNPNDDFKVSTRSCLLFVIHLSYREPNCPFNNI